MKTSPPPTAPAFPCQSEPRPHKQCPHWSSAWPASAPAWESVSSQVPAGQEALHRERRPALLPGGQGPLNPGPRQMRRRQGKLLSPTCKPVTGYTPSSN